MCSNQRDWVPLTRDPPSVLYGNEIWLVCPLAGFDCLHVPRDQFGEAWAVDVMEVHVTLHHCKWDHHK